MGSFCSPSPATVNQTQTYTPNPQVKAGATQALNMAESAADQPFQMPQAPVAGFNPFQQQAFGQIQGMQGFMDPYVQNAGTQMDRAGQPLTAQDIQSYENPYADQALGDMKKYIFDPQRRDTMGRGVQSAGGVGAERLALTSQNLDKTQADAIGQARAGFYSNAAQIAQNQKNMALQSAQGWLGLGQGAQSGDLQATGALGQAGAQQQGQTQRELMSPYQQTLARIAYPFQTSQFLAGIAGGLAPAFGGTTTGQGTSMPTQPSMFSQLTGLTLGGIGAAGSMGAFGGSGSGSWPAGPSNAPSYPNPQGGSWYGNRGGAVNYAEGGEVEDDGNPWAGIIPHMNLPMGGGQNTGAHLNLTPPAEQKSSSGGGGDMAKAASMAMMFLDRGGAVNPWNSAQGYAEGGGDVEEVSPDQFNSIDATAPAQPNIFQPSVGTPGDVGTMPMPGAYTRPPPPAIPNQSMPQPLPPVSRPQAQPMAPTPRAYNPDLKLQDFMMPKSQNPYPDALDRDVGQQMSRSPWLALMAAGAKIAQSTGKPGAALGAGMEAGIGTLTKQRAELRSEQQINQKADELYRHAKSELNKYTRMTPRETEATSETKRYHDILAGLGQGKIDATNNRIDANTTLGREKIEAQLKTGNLVYAGPVRGEEGMGYFYDRKHLDENGSPKIFKAPFDVGQKPGTAGKESTRQWAYRTYKDLYPKDEQGAADILKGHKTMSDNDLRKAADSIAKTAMEKQNIQIQDTEEWLAEHKRLSDSVYKKRKEELEALNK